MGHTILIVDDEADNVTLLEKRLHAEGYKTLLAYSGEEALQLAQHELPNLIILDLMMPGLSGYDVAQTLQNNPDTADIPYIFLTAKSTIDNRVWGLEMGASDYIVKPFHFKELLARINKILKNSKQLSHLKSENLKLQQLSIVDDLTSLYNRRYFSERLAEETKRAERYHYSLACIMIDIDHFKKINDSYGHLIGDRILQELADIIRSSTRVVDVVARFGGEEFVILLPQTNLQGGLLAAEKIRCKTESHLFDDEEGIKITVSIGVSCYEEGQDSMNLIHHADLALYNAKNSGRNQTRVYQLNNPSD